MGATYLRFVLASADGESCTKIANGESELGPKAVISQIRDGIGRLIGRKKECGVLRGIAIGVPGAVHPRTGKVWMRIMFRVGEK